MLGRIISPELPLLWRRRRTFLERLEYPLLAAAGIHMEVAPMGGIDAEDSSTEFRATTKKGLRGDISEVGVEGEDKFGFLLATPDFLVGLGLYLSCGALLLIGCIHFTALSTGAGIGGGTKSSAFCWSCSCIGWR